VNHFSLAQLQRSDGRFDAIHQHQYILLCRVRLPEALPLVSVLVVVPIASDSKHVQVVFERLADATFGMPKVNQLLKVALLLRVRRPRLAVVKDH